MDGGVWEATVHGVAKGQTRLSEFTSLSLHFFIANWQKSCKERRPSSQKRTGGVDSGMKAIPPERTVWVGSWGGQYLLLF